MVNNIFARKSSLTYFRRRYSSNIFGIIIRQIFSSYLFVKYFRRKYFVKYFRQKYVFKYFRQNYSSNIFVWNISSKIFVVIIRQILYIRHKYFVECFSNLLSKICSNLFFKRNENIDILKCITDYVNVDPESRNWLFLLRPPTNYF